MADLDEVYEHRPLARFERAATMIGATPELSIVLPVYNEGEAVEPILRALSAARRAMTGTVVSASKS